MQSRHIDNNVFLDIKLKKNFNILSKSIIDLASQNISNIIPEFSEIAVSGSNYSSQIKGFLIERNYTGDSDQGKDYFIEYVDNKESNTLELTIEDTSDKAKLRNLKSIESLVSLKNINEIKYNVSYFEIPSEEIIKSKVLLTDFLIRQQFYNRNKTYSLTKMEKIAESVQNKADFEEILEIDFYKALSKISSSNSILLTKDKFEVKPKLNLETLFQSQFFLFKITPEDYIKPELELINKKIFRINRRTNQRLLISEKSFKINKFKLFKQNNKFYGHLLNRKTAKKYSNNKNFIYEIELKFNIYNNKSTRFTTEKKLIRL
tara:strand:- start:8882 stop:9838 length:957 start_codon:yes stop_codon:yes gene_type:complete